MPLQSNPFLKTYDAVYDLLFGGVNNELASIIKVGNRVTYGSLNTNRDSLKDSIQAADTPELILQDEGGIFNPHANSSGCSYTQSFGIYVSTGDYRYGQIASLINWYLACNVAKWGTTLGALTWKDVHYVKGIQTIHDQLVEINPERNRNIKGWNCVWRIQLELRIPNVNLVYTED